MRPARRGELMRRGPDARSWSRGVPHRRDDP